MANSVFVNCPRGVWTPVAINVKGGQLKKMKAMPLYFSYYVFTGGAVPTTFEQGSQIFVKREISEPISGSQGLDIYVWCTRVAGRVRVDASL